MGKPSELAYHPLETVHKPRELVYLDIIGPITGIRSEYRYILTAIDDFSRLLATRPLPNRQAKTIVAAIHDIFTREMGIPGRAIVDRGSGTRANWELRVKASISRASWSVPTVHSGA